MSDDDNESESDSGGGDKQDQMIALLRDIRDQQKELLTNQKSYDWILLPICALLAMLLILGLAGFFQA